MKAFVTIFLSLLILVCSTSKALVYIAFKLNQDYIAAELCENRFETLTLCSGKCYLDRQLESLDQQGQDSSPIQKVETKDFHFPSLQEPRSSFSHATVQYQASARSFLHPRSHTPHLLKPPRLLFLV